MTRILLVEDEALIARDERSMLETLEYEVVDIASTGNKAIKKALSLKPDLILMDIRLNGEIDGIDAAGKIHEQSAVPIIFLTGHSDDETLQRAKKAQPYGFITKPFELNLLRSVIEMALYKSEMDAKLRENEEKYRTLFDNIADSIMIFDKKTNRFLDCNSAVKRVYDYSKDEFKSMTPFDLHPKDEVEEVMENIDIRNTDDPKTYHHLTKSGRKISVEICTDEIVYEGKPAWISIVRNITDRKQAEAALEREKKLAQQYLDVTNIMLVALNREQEVTLINPKGCEILGYPGNEIVGHNWFDKFLPYENIEEVKRIFDQLISGDGNLVEYYENQVIRKDGNTRLLAWHNSILRDDFGNIVGIFSSGEDITERKQAEEALHESEDRLNQVISGAELGVWDWDVRSGHTIFNDRWAEMLGYTLGELDPDVKTWESLIHPDDQERTMSILSLHFERKMPFYEVEFRMKTKAGEWKWVMSSSKVVEWSEDRQPLRMTGIFRDIHARKDAEEALRVLNLELEERVRQRTQELEAFSYTVSHDLRAPLRAIGSFSKILDDEYKNQLDDEGQRYLQIIVDNTKQMDHLIKDLLEFSRLGNKQLRKSKVNMKNLVNALYEDLKPAYAECAIELQLNKLPPAFGDPVLIRQVFSNLISNAVKFSSPRDMCLLEVGSEKIANKTAYYVKDNGVGFEMQYADKLFDIFHRLHVSEDFEGTGVGLAIVKRIINKHGGEVWAESALNKGATFYFTLPKQKV